MSAGKVKVGDVLTSTESTTSSSNGFSDRVADEWMRRRRFTGSSSLSGSAIFLLLVRGGFWFRGSLPNDFGLLAAVINSSSLEESSSMTRASSTGLCAVGGGCFADEDVRLIEDGGICDLASEATRSLCGCDIEVLCVKEFTAMDEDEFTRSLAEGTMGDGTSLDCDNMFWGSLSRLFALSFEAASLEGVFNDGVTRSIGLDADVDKNCDCLKG